MFKDEVCCKCQTKGHMKVCTKSTKKLQRRQDQNGRRGQPTQPGGKQKAHYVQENEQDVYTMYHLSSELKKTFKVGI